MNIIKKLTNFGRYTWTTKLSQAVFAYNISLHRAINTSPYILKYGAQPDMSMGKELGQSIPTVPRTEIQSRRDKHFKKYAEKAIQKGKNILNIT